MEYDLAMDFHSFLSDSKIQHASTVYNHMDKLLAKLKKLGVLKDGGRVLCMTDGCAAQYRSATSLFWMVMNARKYNIVLDRGICCAGHGKSIVDAINGVDKNTILRYTMRSVLDAENALNKKSKSIQVHSFNNASGEKYSAAADCKRILEEEGGQGVKSAGLKYKKREKERGINQRYWEVRGLDEKLLQPRCVTVNIPEKGVTFKDMHHYYACPELGGNKKLQTALRRIPCNCPACDKTIRLPWIAGKPAKEQQRFINPNDCFFRPVLDDINKWYIVDLEISDKGVPTDAEEAYRDVLHHMSSTLAESVEVGQIGAVSTVGGDDATDGYYLIKFTSLPYPDQKGDGDMKVEGKWLHKFPRTNHWYYQDETTKVEVFNMEHVVDATVVMDSMSAQNQPPRVVKRQATEREAQKINDNSHYKIMDEIIRRESLEYDPTRVLVGEEEEDNFDSDDEE